MEITQNRFGGFTAKGPASQVIRALKLRLFVGATVTVLVAVLAVPRPAWAMSAVKRLGGLVGLGKYLE